jgi:hypothetical protein
VSEQQESFWDRLIGGTQGGPDSQRKEKVLHYIIHRLKRGHKPPRGAKRRVRAPQLHPVRDRGDPYQPRAGARRQGAHGGGVRERGTGSRRALRFSFLKLLLTYSGNILEGKFPELRIARVQSGGVGSGHSTFEANDQGQRSRWLVRRESLR